MARYAIGDIQGCLQPLRCLLDRVAFDPACDQLWLVGDLVNRGPDSLGVLRFVRALGDSAHVVLGNHDLHLLAIASGHGRLSRSDTVQDVLAADDRDELLDWLRHRPLLHCDPSGDYAMVHAGLAPQWTLAQAAALAREVEAALQGEQSDTFFATMYGNTPDCWHDSLSGWARLRAITNYMTRMRFCRADGTLDLSNKTNSPSDNSFAPWFALPQRQTRDQRLIFGHWAALQGRAGTPNIYALDTGCVWGGALTLLALDSGEYQRCDCAGAAATGPIE